MLPGRRVPKILVGLAAGLVVTLTLSACDTDNAQQQQAQQGAQEQALQTDSPSMGENGAKSKMDRPENFTDCPRIRPEMCTQQYDPACGYFYADKGDDEKTFRTFGNQCTACQNSAIEGYVPGECPD